MSREIWPRIREELPEAEMYCYGAYLDKETSRLSDGANGFHVRGLAKDLSIMYKHRVCLAPLRFGAGIKGKILDSWWHGLPVCTTPIGAEGLCDDSSDDFGGLGEADTADKVAGDAVRLYKDRELWVDSQAYGFKIMRDKYDSDTNGESLNRLIEETYGRLHHEREADLIGSMLWHHTARSTEYFSKWIEAKNT